MANFTDARISRIELYIEVETVEYTVEFYDSDIEEWVRWPQRVTFYLNESLLSLPTDDITGQPIPVGDLKYYFDNTANRAAIVQQMYSGPLAAIKARAGVV